VRKLVQRNETHHRRTSRREFTGASSAAHTCRGSMRIAHWSIHDRKWCPSLPALQSMRQSASKPSGRVSGPASFGVLPLPTVGQQAAGSCQRAGL